MNKIITYGSFAALLLLLLFSYMDFLDKKKIKCKCEEEETTTTEQPPQTS
jgi:uncharacterized membrane protein YjfL (UPF0719 family)